MSVVERSREEVGGVTCPWAAALQDLVAHRSRTRRVLWSLRVTDRTWAHSHLAVAARYFSMSALVAS